MFYNFSHACGKRAAWRITLSAFHFTERVHRGGTIRDVKEIERYLGQFQGAVYGLACSMLRSNDLADDVTQETFIAFCDCDCVFESDDHVRNWLLKVAANKCRNILRARKAHPTVALGESLPNVEMALRGSEEEQAAHDERQLVLWDHVAQLPPSLRAAVFLHYAAELSGRQIAEVLGTTEAAIHTRLHRARRILKQALEREDAQ